MLQVCSRLCIVLTLPNLQTNSAHNNLIGEVPPEIGGLRFLQTLSLRGNCIHGTVPNEIWRLASLKEINLEWNALSGEVSSGLYELPALTHLMLGWNKNEVSCNQTDGHQQQWSSPGLQGNIFGSNITQLSRLREISLSTNSFNGSISSELGSLRRLGKLFLNANDNVDCLVSIFTVIFNVNFRIVPRE